MEVMGSGWRSVLRLGRGSDGTVTKPFSRAFKQKMVEQRPVVEVRSVAGAWSHSLPRGPPLTAQRHDLCSGPAELEFGGEGGQEALGREDVLGHPFQDAPDGLLDGAGPTPTAARGPAPTAAS